MNLKLIKVESFSIVIMDIQMPFLDGWQTAKIFREMGFEGVIIACSAIGLNIDEFNSMNEHFNAYLPKPVFKNDLIKCLNER